MKYDDPSSYYFDNYVAEMDPSTYQVNPYSQGTGMVWPYGAENWCNLEGTYLHIVADLSHLMSSIGSINQSICTVGVFGTRYVRGDGDAVPSSLEVASGTSKTLSIAHIHSELTIGTTLDINLRFGGSAAEQLSFVSLSESASATSVVIDATELQEGDEYNLILQSFNTLSTAKSTLKTDTIKIVVVQPTPPSFEEDLSVQVLTSGQALSWSLPEV